MALHSFNYGGDNYKYDVFHSAERRGKIAIHVFPNGSIQVDAPADAYASEVKGAVLKRARWILNHVEEAKSRLKHILPREYVSGESHYYLGRRYLLKVIPVEDEEQSVKLFQGKLQVNCFTPSANRVSLLLSSWYKDKAASILRSRLSAVSDSVTWLGEIPPMKMLTMQKQWGSCSASGNIILNPSLVKAPKECIDYVIAHEICHLREHNHSQRFYRELDQILPNWRSIKGRLDGMAEAILAK